jgi:hypothetical protein
MALGYPLSHSQRKRAQQSHKFGPAVLMALAAYASNETGTCYPTLRSVARKAGCSLKCASDALKQFLVHGIIGREARSFRERQLHPGGRYLYTIVADDGPRGHIRVSHAWIDQHVELGPAALSAYSTIRSFGNGRWRFEAEFDRVRLALGVSRSTFYRSLDRLEKAHLVSHSKKNGCWWVLHELRPPDDAPIKRNLAAQVFTRASQHSDPSTHSGNVPKTTLKQAFEAHQNVPKTTYELYKPKTNKALGFDLDSSKLHKNVHDASLGKAREGVTAKNPTSQGEDQSQKPNPPASVRRDTTWIHEKGLCKHGWIENLICPECSKDVPVANHGCNGTGWRTFYNGYQNVISHCPYCACAEHGCFEGIILFLDGGKVRRAACERCRLENAQKKQELETARQAAEEAARAKREFEERKRAAAGTLLWGGLNFADIFQHPQSSVPHLPAAPVLDVPKLDMPPRTLPTYQIPPKIFARLWHWIACETNRRRDGWDQSTQRRVNGMLRQLPGGIDPDDFHSAMCDVIREKWQAKHGHCHDHCTCSYDPCECQSGCDGSCGHDPDECNGCVYEWNITDKKLLDLIGRAVGILNDEHSRDTRCGVDPDTGAARTCYESGGYRNQYGN